MQLSPRENISMALTAVWTNRFRSMLTILGIVIGISTVVTVASLLSGLRQGIVTFFDELGPDNVFVYKTSGDPNQTFAPPKERKRRALKKEYVETLRRYASHVEQISLALFIPNASNGKVVTAKVPGFETDSLSMAGVTPNAIETAPKDFDQGRFFTDEENERVAHVAVIGFDLARAPPASAPCHR